MIHTITQQQTQAQTLRQLPMSPLEEALKTVFLQRDDIHDKILSSDEIQGYHTWMATNFDASNDFQAQITMDGTIGQLGRHLLQHPKDLSALNRMTALYAAAPEANIFAAGQDITICHPLRYLPPYWHTSDYFEVYYVFAGNLPVHFKNETIVLHPGDVIIVPPFVMNAAVYTSDDVVILEIMIRSSTFRQVFLDQLAPSNLMTMFFTKALSRSAESNYLLFQTGLDSELEHLLLSIYNSSTEKDPYSIRMRNPLASTFFLYLLRQYEHIAQVSSHSTLSWKPEFSEMLIYIQTNYRTVTLEKVSQKFGYSPRQIMRIIKNSTDKTFTALLTQLRMEKAVALIKQNKLSIEQIAQEVGYASLSGFYYSFRNYYGISPGQWLEDQRDL